MNVIVFGATGMVGQGVLRQCLLDPSVQRVLVIGRSSSGLSHAKLHEWIKRDMFDFSSDVDALVGYDACLFCLGVSSIGMKEPEYTRLSYDLTMGWARLLAKANPNMAFEYVSGAGTGGRAMWAQVKGRVERDLMQLFPNAYMIRLGALIPVHGERSKTKWARAAYAVLRPLVPLLRVLGPRMFITTEELGRAMLRAAGEHPTTHVLEMPDLQRLAGR